MNTGSELVSMPSLKSGRVGRLAGTQCFDLIVFVCSCVSVSPRSNRVLDSKIEDLSGKVRLTGRDWFRFMVEIKFCIRMEFGHFKFRLKLMVCVRSEYLVSCFTLKRCKKRK